MWTVPWNWTVKTNVSYYLPEVSGYTTLYIAVKNKNNTSFIHSLFFSCINHPYFSIYFQYVHFAVDALSSVPAPVITLFPSHPSKTTRHVTLGPYPQMSGGVAFRDETWWWERNPHFKKGTQLKWWLTSNSCLLTWLQTPWIKAFKSTIVFFQRHLRFKLTLFNPAITKFIH